MDQGILRNPDSRAVESLERDHEGLDELVAVLDIALGDGDYDASLFDEAFNQLVEDVERHFRKEEAWMKRLAYPSLDSHSGQHEMLMEALVDFRRGFACNPARSNAFVIRSFVDDWLVHHMIEVDQSFERFAGRKPG